MGVTIKVPLCAVTVMHVPFLCLHSFLHLCTQQQYSQCTLGPNTIYVIVDTSESDPTPWQMRRNIVSIVCA